MPLSLIPPNGTISVEMMPSLMPTMRVFDTFGDTPDAADVVVKGALIHDFEFFSMEHREN
jgi:hypothetical protein